MSEPKMTKDQYGEPYEPTPEELVGESYFYCYGQPNVIPPPLPEESDDAHH